MYIMKKLLIPIIIALVFAACNPKQPTANVDLVKEKQAVQLVIDNYLKAFSAKDSVGIIKLFVDDAVLYVNCDSVPVKGVKAIQDHFKKAYSCCKSCKMDAAKDVNILMDKDAVMANAVFTVPCECMMEGMEACMKMSMIMDFTLTKDSVDWKIANALMTKKGGHGCGQGKCSDKDMKGCCKDGKMPDCKGADPKKCCPGAAKKAECPHAKK
jgi:uncharacterized protein (TIGR02246 family)